MPITWRGTELRLLLPLVVLMPMGFALAHIVAAGKPDPGPLGLALAYVALVLGAHIALVLLGHRGDQLLFPLAATTGGVGLVMLNRLPQTLAGMNLFGVEVGMATTQLVWFAISLVAMVAIAVFFRDDGILRHYKYTWALAGAGLLVITFLFGTEINGARLWLSIGPVTFQPGEAIKIVLVVFIAGYLAEKRALLAGANRRIGPIKIPPLPYLLPMLAIFAIVMVMVVISKDLGIALLFYGIFLTMLFVATGRRSYVLIGLVLFVAGSYVAYLLFPHVHVRVDNWLDPFADPTGTGYQTVQALYAFGRGGLFAIETDFIFTAIAEELGLVGAFALLALAAALVARGLRIAILARDDFSSLMAIGLTTSLGLQTLIIVAGNAKLIPLTGITFPFVSYGGSSLLASFVVLGLLLSISHRTAADEGTTG